MKNSALYILTVFAVFMSLSGMLARYSATRSAVFTRRLISFTDILVSADTCFYFAGMGFLLNFFSSAVQWLMKILLGLVFIDRNGRLDYTLALVIIFTLYLVFYYVETRLRPQENKVVCINSFNFERVKVPHSNTFFVINVVCAAIAALMAVCTFLNSLFT